MEDIENVKLSFWTIPAIIFLAASAFSAARPRFAISIDVMPDAGGVVRCDPTVRDATSDAIVFQPSVRTPWGRNAATTADDGARSFEATLGFSGDVASCAVRVREKGQVVASRSESRRRG